jgi:hypothetical protein
MKHHSKQSVRRGATPATTAKLKKEADRRLDEELADSFPASDPPSILRGGVESVSKNKT